VEELREPGSCGGVDAAGVVLVFRKPREIGEVGRAVIAK
jgi:hypothetical protein